MLIPFFRRPPRWKIIPVLEPTKIITVLRRTSIQLTKSFTRLIFAFQETAQEYFLRPKFDNVLSTFFVYRLDGKLALFHNLLGLSHTLVDSHFIWKRPSLDWTSLFKKLHKCILSFEFKIWRVNSFFFVDHLDGKLSPFQNLLRLSQFYAGPQFNWQSPSLDWKSLFMKLHKSIFWARNLTTC